MSQRIVIETLRPCHDCDPNDKQVAHQVRTAHQLDEMVEKGARLLHDLDYEAGPGVWESATEEVKSYYRMVSRYILVAALGLEET